MYPHATRNLPRVRTPSRGERERRVLACVAWAVAASPLKRKEMLVAVIVFSFDRQVRVKLNEFNFDTHSIMDKAQKEG